MCMCVLNKMPINITEYLLYLVLQMTCSILKVYHKNLIDQYFMKSIKVQFHHRTSDSLLNISSTANVVKINALGFILNEPLHPIPCLMVSLVFNVYTAYCG